MCCNVHGSKYSLAPANRKKLALPTVWGKNCPFLLKLHHYAAEIENFLRP